MLSPLSGTLTPLSRRRKVSAAPFGPADIPGLQLWLEADSIAGVADGDPVATWPDRSGHGRDATQATAGKRPPYRAASAGALPAVRGDGIDDQLNVAGVTLPQPFTYFLLLDSAPTNGVYIFDGSPYDRCGVITNSSYFRAYGGGSLQPGTPRATATPSLICVVADGASSSLEVYDGTNGDYAATGDIGAADLTAPWQIGGINIATAYFDGGFTAVLIYDSALAPGVRANVKNYLKSKYRI